MSVPLTIRTTERKKRGVSLDLARGAMYSSTECYYDEL